MKTYRGRRVASGLQVLVSTEANTYTLTPAASQKVWNHSPDGFEWGYGGSGPAQLALALLMDFGLSNQMAVDQHQDFKFAVVARMPKLFWELNDREISFWVKEPDKAKSYFESKWDGGREEPGEVLV